MHADCQAAKMSMIWKLQMESHLSWSPPSSSSSMREMISRIWRMSVISAISDSDDVSESEESWKAKPLGRSTAIGLIRSLTSSVAAGKPLHIISACHKIAANRSLNRAMRHTEYQHIAMLIAQSLQSCSMVLTSCCLIQC